MSLILWLKSNTLLVVVSNTPLAIGWMRAFATISEEVRRASIVAVQSIILEMAIHSLLYLKS